MSIKWQNLVHAQLVCAYLYSVCVWLCLLVQLLINNCFNMKSPSSSTRFGELSSDLLRRLSTSQNTVFCGRIQLFLARLFPLSEKSGKYKWCHTKLNLHTCRPWATCNPCLCKDLHALLAYCFFDWLMDWLLAWSMYCLLACFIFCLFDLESNLI